MIYYAMLTCCNNSTSSHERSDEFRGREMRRLQEASAPKKQHYVPQYYLRRFSDDGDSLWVFNRKAGKTYKSRSEDVCERNYHYEMEARCQRSWHGRHLLPGKIEKKLSEIEGEQALLLREIDAQLDVGRIHEKERRALLWLVGHLIARHPAMLADYEPDYEAMYSDPEVRWGCEVLAQAGMADEIEVLAQGANQMVLALWRCKGSPTYFAKSDLERLRCRLIRPQGEARFITSSLPPHFNTTLQKDGKYHIDDLTLPLSSTLAVVYSDAGPTKCDVLKVPDSTVVRLNSGYFVSEPTCEQVVSGRREDLDQARILAQRFRISAAMARRENHW